MSCILYPGTDRSGVTLAGSTEVAGENRVRRGLVIQNTSDVNMFITETGEDAANGVNYKIEPGQGFSVSTNMAVNIWSGVAGKTFAATEF